MSGKWVPKWKKDQEAAELEKTQKEVETVKSIEKTDDNFPSLNGNVGPSRVVVWEKKFSDLALEWKSETEKNIEEDNIQKEFAKYQHMSAPIVPKLFKLPIFPNKQHYIEEEEEEEYDEDKPVYAAELDDAGWTLVDNRKIRRVKPTLDVLDQERPPTPPEENMWKDDAPAEHETCWEDRN